MRVALEIGLNVAGQPGIEDVRFLGYLPLGDMPSSYSLAQALIHPSLLEDSAFPS